MVELNLLVVERNDIGGATASRLVTQVTKSCFADMSAMFVEDGDFA